MIKLSKVFKHVFYKYFFTPEQYARKSGVKIGKNCSIGTRLFGSEPYLIEIGDNVQITHGVKFFTHGGGWLFRDEYPQFDTFGKIKLGSNIYVGNNSLIMPGVYISDNTIIGAGSVVTKSVKAEGLIIAGNPAKEVGKVKDLKERMLSYNLNTKGLSYNKKREFLLNQPEDSFFSK